MVRLAEDDARYRGQFTQLLLGGSHDRDLAAGFGLASDIGGPVAPVLWALHAGEKSNARRRITVLAAAVLSEGPLGDERVLGLLEQDRAQLHDRLMSAFALALLPRRTREQPQFWSRVFGRNKQEPVQLLAVLALLASSRFPAAAAATPPAVLRDGDPGVVAAALYAGAPVPEALVQPYWRPDPPAHAALVWRGAFLGRLHRDGAENGDAVLVQRAREVLAMPGEVHATAREAAALLLGRLGQVDQDARPDWSLLQLLAADRKTAASVRAWLTAGPQPLAEEPAVLAVEYVLSRSPTMVLEDRAAWANAPTIRAHVALALAWQLCAGGAEKPIDWAIAGLPEWYFVRWATGVRAPRDEAIADPVLEQAARLCAEDRMPREVAQRLFEEALWRLGSHPGLGLWRAQREFVRDLVLAGSVPGSRYQIGLRDHLRYVPGGLRHEDDFFEVAVELYEFMGRRVPPVPVECRLR